MTQQEKYNLYPDHTFCNDSNHFNDDLKAVKKLVGSIIESTKEHDIDAFSDGIDDQIHSFEDIKQVLHDTILRDQWRTYNELKEKEWITNTNQYGAFTLKYSNNGDELTFFKIGIGADGNSVKLNCVPINPLEETQVRIESIHPKAYPTYTFKLNNDSYVDTIENVKKLVSNTINDADKSSTRGLSVGDINKFLQKNILSDQVLKPVPQTEIRPNETESRNDLKSKKVMSDFNWYENEEKTARTGALGGVIEAKQLNPSHTKISVFEDRDDYENDRPFFTNNLRGDLDTAKKLVENAIKITIVV